LARETASLDAALSEYETAYDELLSESLPAVDRAADDSEAVRAWVAPMLDRVAALEAEAGALRRNDRMSALDDVDVSGITMKIEQAPTSMAAGAVTWVRVELSNGLTDRALGTWPPFPLQFACRWRRLDASQPVITEDAHTPLGQPVPPGETRSLAVRAVAPAVPGRYQLRVVLVQEWWRWLDETPTPVVADANVAVVRQTLLTGLAGAPRAT
jgi:hypothetical protein